jgi:hypothetical protein
MKLNTLDRFFVRRDRPRQEGEDAATQSGEAPSVQEADQREPGGEAGPQTEAAEAPCQRRAAPGTLDAFLVRQDASAETPNIAEERLYDLQRHRHPLPRS